jgi:hypothetical protein
MPYLIVPRRLVVRVQKEVHMEIDQSRRQRCAGKVDPDDIRRRLKRGQRTDGRDHAVVNANGPARFHGVAVRGPDVRRHDQEVVLRRVGCAREKRAVQDQQTRQ